jgi:hypothetical protein
VGGKIDSIDSIVMNYPTDFLLATDGCNPKPAKEAQGRIEWIGMKSGDQIIFCHFQALRPAGSSSKLGTSPTKTYVVTAHANYTYSNSKEKLVTVLFGSWCCTQETGVCATDQKCCAENPTGIGKGICTPKTQNCEGGTGGATSGCCQNAESVGYSCYDVSTNKCDAGTFVSNAACNTGTGMCESKTS